MLLLTSNDDHAARSKSTFAYITAVGERNGRFARDSRVFDFVHEPNTFPPSGSCVLTIMELVLLAVLRRCAFCDTAANVLVELS